MSKLSIVVIACLFFVAPACDADSVPTMAIAVKTTGPGALGQMCQDNSGSVSSRIDAKALDTFPQLYASIDTFDEEYVLTIFL
jgi:hypothetical protein